MAPNEYSKALGKAVTDLEDRVQKRDILNAEIAGLRETVRVLTNRTTLTKEEREAISRLLDMVDYATPSLGDSIRTVLTKAFPNRMTAIEVRNALENSGFNFDDFSNSLSACHAALKRMLSDEEVDSEQSKDGKTAYRKILKLTPPSTISPRSTLLEMMKKAARTAAAEQAKNNSLDSGGLMPPATMPPVRIKDLK
jgi:hypothetical protein